LTTEGSILEDWRQSRVFTTQMGFVIVRVRTPDCEHNTKLILKNLYKKQLGSKNKKIKVQGQLLNQ
jgi:hypothetical protein